MKQKYPAPARKIDPLQQAEIINKEIERLEQERDSCLNQAFHWQVVDIDKNYSRHAMDMKEMSLEFFKSITEKNKLLSTPFASLNKALNGGLRNGLTIIGGGSSVGKTAFVQQLAYHIMAKENRAVFHCNLEMSMQEIVARDISRVFFQMHQKALPISKIFDGLNIDAPFQETWKNYEKNTRGIFKFYSPPAFGASVNDIRYVFLDAWRKADTEPPVLIVDYLQAIKGSDPRSTDLQNIDHTIQTLKAISREFKVPVILLSSFNRASYSDNANMASFKGAGTIEYTADTLIALELYSNKGNIDGNTKDDRARNLSQREKALRKLTTRPIELSILKNRNGTMNDTLYFTFKGDSMLYTESNQEALDKIIADVDKEKEHQQAINRIDPRFSDRKKP